MLTISGVSERRPDGTGLVQLMGKSKGEVSLPACGHQITDHSIKDQAAPIDPHWFGD